MIYLDFETRSRIDLKKLGATRYAWDASTSVLCLCWAYDQDEEVHLWHRRHEDKGGCWAEKSPRPDELIERIKNGELVEAHNAKFEFNIWNFVLTREFPEFDVQLQMEQMRCSAAKASCLSLPRALGDAANAIQLTERKDTDGQRLINKLSKPMVRRGSRKVLKPGEKFLKTVRLNLYGGFRLGNTYTLDWAYGIALDVAAGHSGAPSTARQVKDEARETMQRAAGEGPSGMKSPYLKRTGQGEFICIRQPDRELQKDRQQYEQAAAAENAELVWCEEQIEHERNWDYCKQDVRTERALSNFCPEMTESELEYWFMDFRMNQRGVNLDQRAAKDAIELCRREVERLDGEMFDLTGGRVPGGSKRIAFKTWANEQVAELNSSGCKMEPLPDTRADTLSFALYGVPTKAADEAKVARKPEMDKLWNQRGAVGATLKKAMEICLEVNRSSVAKFKTMNAAVCSAENVGEALADGRLHDIMLYNGADRTGRWSGQGVQPHNFVRGYSKDMVSVWETLLTLDELGDHDLDYITMIEGAPLPVLAKACRGALIASDDMELYAADFKAIEARKLAWMAGCASQLNLFRTGGDPYVAMASAIYNLPVDMLDKTAVKAFAKAHPTERQLGKKAVLGLGYCLAADTLILTQRGWVCIDKVQDWDMLWDGQEWVHHRGLVCNGEKYVMNLDDTFPTMDHPVWCGGQFYHAEKVGADDNLRRRALELGAEALPLPDMSSVPAAASDISWLGADAGHRNIKSIWRIGARVAQLAATFARSARRRISGTLPISQQCQKRNTASDSSIGSLPLSVDATTLATQSSKITGGAGSKFAWSGIKIVPRSCGTFGPFRDGMIRLLNWIEKTMAATMSRAIFASRPGVSKSAIRAGRKENVYDLLDAGPRHRYTILTRKGPMIVHNSMGWEKFQATVWAEEGIWLDDNFCKKVVNIYRKVQCPEMPILWKAIERAAIAAVQEGGEHFAGGDPTTGAGRISYFVEGRFLHCRLPSGRLLAYLDPEVHEKVNYRYAARNERGTPCLVTFPSKIGVPMSRVKHHAEQVAERQRKTLSGDPPESFLSPHLSFIGRHIVTKEWKRLGTHGGSLTENADQASSRDLLAEAMYRVDEREEFDLLLSIHDEVIAEAPIGTMTVPEFEAIMCEVPIWATGMPIDAEGWKGKRLRK